MKLKLPGWFSRKPEAVASLQPEESEIAMSWLNKLGKGVMVAARFAGPIATIAGVPGAGLINAISGGVLRAQAALPEPGSGVDKATMVVNEFEAGLETTQDVLNSLGKKLVYDQAALKEAIDAQVVVYKALAKVKDSYKIIDTATRPA